MRLFRYITRRELAVAIVVNVIVVAVIVASFLALVHLLTSPTI